MGNQENGCVVAAVFFPFLPSSSAYIVFGIHFLSVIIMPFILPVPFSCALLASNYNVFCIHAIGMGYGVRVASSTKSYM